MGIMEQEKQPKSTYFRQFSKFRASLFKISIIFMLFLVSSTALADAPNLHVSKQLVKIVTKLLIRSHIAIRQ